MRILWVWAAAALLAAGLRAADGQPRWWKGNLHTHSLWSDGDDFPEMITGWYKAQGYHFLAISDHNTLQEGQRWINIGTNAARRLALQKYLDRFGTNWVDVRRQGSNDQVRLKTFLEYRSLFEEAGRFLLIQSEEITDAFKNLPVHMNASNIRDFIKPQGGSSVREVMQNNVNAVLEQRRKTGQRIVPHLNHPNFQWGVTAEDLAAVRGEHFFEVYNGHPGVNDEGDETHASTDRLWDIALTLRLSSDNPEPLYGIAVDDSHHYHRQGANLSNAGRGWIHVRATHLTPEHILRAMEKGEFYASSGTELSEIHASTNELRLSIKAKPGVSYRTEFIGTRRGVDLDSEQVTDTNGVPLPVTRRYSKQLGETLATVEGAAPAYKLKGDELYVRARVTSSKDKENPGGPTEKEMAWTQPVFPGAAFAPAAP